MNWKENNEPGNRRRLFWLTASLGLAAASMAMAGTNYSDWAYPGPGGRLLRQPDALGNRVLNYSAVGYHGGTVPLPVVPVKVTISPVAGDDGASIQAAINQVKALPMDSSGFRGAVLLMPGEYQISNSITLNASGVVLRGSGDGPGGTVLRASGAGQRTLVNITGSGSPATVSGSTRDILDLYVPVGACSFTVPNTTGLAVGDRVMIRRQANDLWIQTLGMDLLGPGSGGDADDVPWTASGYSIDFDRIITRLEGNRVTVDAPITTAIEEIYGGGTLREFTWSGRIQNVGIEDIRGVSDYASSTDEDHGWTFVRFSAVEHAWAARLTSVYFGYSCVSLSSGSRCVTVTDCTSLDPVSLIEGGRRYAFVMDDAQLCLVRSCYTLKDRHQFVTQSLTTGPNVFVDGLNDTAYSDAGPHHRWGSGALWDNIRVNGNSLNVQNRGNLGTGHGWAGANEVVWNCYASGGYVVQNPPTARNWLIGSVGPIKTGTVYVGPHDPGTYDSHGSNVFPGSIYYAQLQDHLLAPETREYWLGDIDRFIPATADGDAVNAAAAWQSALTAAGATPLKGFDRLATNQCVPMSFSFTLGTGRRLAGASLALAVRPASNPAASPVLYIENASAPIPFSALGWAAPAPGTNATVYLLDLHGRLDLLADGRLDIAVLGDAGVDWALLDMSLAPTAVTVQRGFEPEADAFVRGGAYQNDNYGTNALLSVKADTSADTQRAAYLRWNLAGVRGRVLEARVRLTPVSVGVENTEHGLALAASAAWSESGLTWSNQPGSGDRFAAWRARVNQPVEPVVTPQVQAALAAGGPVAFRLFAIENAGAPGLASYASREDTTPSRRPQLILVLSNTAPFISPIADQGVPPGGLVGPIEFTVDDFEDDPAALALTAASSNTNLVPVAAIALGGAGSNRTVTVTPAAGQSGSALITLTATDAAGAAGTAAFSVMVNTVDQNGTWLADAGGDWSQSANWAGNLIAGGTGRTATFAVDVTGSRTVQVGSPRVLGNLVFTDAAPATAGEWTLAGGSLSLQVSAGSPQVQVTNVLARIQSPLGGTQGLAKQGGGTLELGGANSFTGLASILGGPLRVTHSSALGSASSGLNIGNDAGARLELSGGISLPEPLTVSCKGSAAGNVPAVLNADGTNSLTGPLVLTTGGSYWTFESAAGLLRVTGPVSNVTTNNARLIWLRGAGDGEWHGGIANSAAGLATNLRKDDSGTWTLAGIHTTTGTILLTNGTLRVDGRTGPGAVTVQGGKLSGGGVIGGPVALSAGAVLAPGPGVSRLTISNTLTLHPQGTTRIEVDAQTGLCGGVQGLTQVIYAGLLEISNRAGLFQPGQSFQLFSASQASGTFSAIQPTPRPGLAWRFDSLTGVLSLTHTTVPVLAAATSGGDQVLLTVTQAIPDSPVLLLATTDVTLSAPQWMRMATNFASPLGTTTFTQSVTFAPHHFFRVSQ